MKLARFFCLVGALLLVVSLSTAAETKRKALIRELKGKVEVKIGSADFVPAVSGMELSQGDSIRTGAGSYAVLDLDGKGQTATIELKNNGNLSLSKLLGDKKQGTQTTLLDLALGEILIKAQKLHSERSRFEVKTPTSVVAVRGTTFSVAVEAVE